MGSIPRSSLVAHFLYIRKSSDVCYAPSSRSQMVSREKKRKKETKGAKHAGGEMSREGYKKIRIQLGRIA